ncbi:MAG: gamma-glutamyl-gamma-aminobutyrate hydrolase family protein [Bacteroidaceae bacterium]|nr:gamma-glutamyl-gamma-aminobutyrate hydrolase family protein [Bacteroidaceae bacterium]MBQ3121449.1 gamma-glutamyl-gamma-aminobutyrate hydrolase family protein [Bacteroidaceae bacterium]
METKRFNLGIEYNELHREYHTGAIKPIIGITANFNDGNACLAEAYYASVLEAGGVPLLIPPYSQREALAETLKTVDALLLSGGADIDPRYMAQQPDYTLLHTINPKRDEQELMLVRLATDRQLPILGICRGIQTLAAALGGEVHQDIYAALGDNLLCHDQQEERGVATHEVHLVPHMRLAKIFGREKIGVNTFHHQAVSVLPQGFKVSAVAPDGVIEGMEAVDGRSIIGVQWHPESFIMKDYNTCMMPLFRWLVAEALLYRRAKNLHRHIISIDSHCDTPMLFAEGYSLGERSNKALVDLHKMDEGALDVVTMVAYLKQEARTAASRAAAVAKAHALLKGIEERVAVCSDCVALASHPDELLPLKRSGKRVIMRGIENGFAIGDDIKNIQHYRNMGVVYMTLCHNGDNDICDSARGDGEHGGLSAFGKEVVREMNRVGMMIDLSHAAETTFYDVLKYSTVPVVCSHSSCRALCNHPRNLTDEQMRAIAAKGGVVQVTMYSGFLVQDGVATLDDFMRHLFHAISVAGVSHVGIGTDFDGDGGVVGCSDASQLRNITREMLRRGLSDADIEAVRGGNWLRVMRIVQKADMNKIA